MLVRESLGIIGARTLKREENIGEGLISGAKIAHLVKTLTRNFRGSGSNPDLVP